MNDEPTPAEADDLEQDLRDLVRLVVSTAGEIIREQEGEKAYAAIETLRQGFSLQQLHHQVVGALLVAHVVEGADVGVVQSGDGPGLVDLAHPTGPEGGQA